MTVAVSERIELARRDVPAAAARLAQVVVDNPGQLAIVAAVTLVAGRAAMNLVRPRTPIEALALLVTLELGMGKGVQLAIDRGWLNFRIRDEAGQLVPLCPSTST